jgi:N-acetylneuraminic acid mutarotase
LYDSDTGSWNSAGTLNVVRFARTASLLQNGKVLVTGIEENGSSAAELYDPETGVWSITGRPTEVRGTATVLSDGRVLLAGGYDSYHPVSGEELYDPATETWSLVAHLRTPRDYHTATLLPDGRVLVAGGMGGDGDVGTIFLDSAELYGPIAIPRIIGASVEGKKLIVVGQNFDRRGDFDQR